MLANMLDAKTHFSRYIALIESGAEDQVIVARNNVPVAKIVPYDAPADTSGRFGVARGAFVVPDDIDELNDEIAAEFGV